MKLRLEEFNMKNFNPRPPRGGRQSGCGLCYRIPEISIHAPREGGDHHNGNPYSDCLEFQSTPPARGATQTQLYSILREKISIHAPREGGDSYRA